MTTTDAPADVLRCGCGYVCTGDTAKDRADQYVRHYRTTEAHQARIAGACRVDGGPPMEAHGVSEDGRWHINVAGNGWVWFGCIMPVSISVDGRELYNGNAFCLGGAAGYFTLVPCGRLRL